MWYGIYVDGDENLLNKSLERHYYKTHSKRMSAVIKC